jgi:hypothetical protein
MIFFGLSIFYNIHIKGDQHFVFLARSFLAGKLYFIEQYASWWHDAVEFLGKHYWPQGPFPGVLLMPAVALFDYLKLPFYQSYIQIFLNLGIYVLMYQIARKVGYTKQDSLFLSFAFAFATVFIGVSFRPTGWFFSQVVATLLTLFAIKAIIEFKRFWLIGILFGLILLTRATAFVGVLFVFWLVLFDKKFNLKKKINSSALIILSLIPFILMFGAYNYFRFGNIWDQGYGIQSIAGNLSGAKSYGLFSPTHLPGNLYYFLIAPPQPVFKDTFSHVLTYPFIKADPWGMGIIFTSPYLLYLFFLKHKDRFSVGLILTIIAISVPVLFYYGIGWFQFGYRYSLDFLPFLFLLFIRNYRSKFSDLSFGIKSLILFSAAFNLFLFSTLFEI